MVLMETLVFFMICLCMVSIVFGCAQVSHRMEVQKEKGYQDDALEALYKP